MGAINKSPGEIPRDGDERLFENGNQLGREEDLAGDLLRAQAQEVSMQDLEAAGEIGGTSDFQNLLARYESAQEQIQAVEQYIQKLNDYYFKPETEGEYKGTNLVDRMAQFDPHCFGKFQELTAGSDIFGPEHVTKEFDGTSGPSFSTVVEHDDQESIETFLSRVGRMA